MLMSFVARLRFGLVCAAVLLSIGLTARADGPHWIGGASVASKTWRFEKSFTAEAAVQSASLKLAADFCTASVVINGQPVLVVEPYCQTQEPNVTSYVRRGENTVLITATYVPGPAAVALSISL